MASQHLLSMRSKKCWKLPSLTLSKAGDKQMSGNFGNYEINKKLSESDRQA
jgi:hypothetical protein